MITSIFSFFYLVAALILLFNGLEDNNQVAYWSLLVLASICAVGHKVDKVLEKLKESK